ncbi:MAG TPA: cation diffusion facilitator family transporter [Micromonospora sp.]|nr:cation diffusion facilitator family transporter [Micromonospora sp.]
MSTNGGTRAIIAALLANLGIAIAKFIGWGLTLSSSMLAESIHSVADSGNQALLLLGGRRSRRKATPQHPFGYGRARYMYAFIVTVVLFTVGGLFALYEGWQKWSQPHGITSWHWVPVVVLVSAIVMESFSFRTAVKESNRERGDASWTDFVRHSKAPELPVVLLEDLGALVGLVFALFGVSMTLATGDGRWDALGSAMIGLLLVAIAIILALEMKSLLLGEAASPEHVAKIEEAITGGAPGRLIHLKTLHLGPDELLVAAKIAVEPGVTAEGVARDIDETEARIRAAVPIARAIYLEPDIYRSSASTEAGGGTETGQGRNEATE